MAYTHTYTLATLEISESAYREVARALKKAGGQEDRFTELRGKPALDMQGVGLIARPKKQRAKV